MARSKKEIDKEIMYKKIMPTASFSNANAEEPSASTAPSALAGPLAQAPTAGSKPFSATAHGLEASPVPAAHESIAEPVEPVNVMEILLEMRLDAAIEKFHCCECDKCRKDIISLTLNKLPPCYIDPQDSARMTDAESKYAGQVATALVQAILNVKSHPTH